MCRSFGGLFSLYAPVEGWLGLELGKVDHAADVEADPAQGDQEHEHPLKHELREAGHAAELVTHEN